MGYVMKVYWILHCQHLFNLLEGWSLSVHDWEGAILCYGMIKNHAFFDGKEAAVKKIYAETLEQQQIEVRKSVMDRLRQAREGQTKDFNTVCDRLEKKYTNAKV